MSLVHGAVRRPAYVLLGLIALLVPALAGSINNYDIRENKVLQGAVVRTLQNIADIPACAASCDGAQFCNSFTYIPSTRACELKAESKFADGEPKGYTSGINIGSSIRTFIKNIATGQLREGTGQKVGTTEARLGVPENKPSIAKNPDGTAQGFVCETKKVTLEQQSEEFVTLDPTEEWLYPGALLQGDTIKGGTPTWVGAKRSGGEIGLALQSGAASPYSQKVAAMDKNQVNQAMNDLLARYNIAQGGTPGEFAITYDEVHSQEHLEAMVGANVTGANFSAGGKLNVDFGNNKNKLLIRITQKFYTMVMQPPRFPEDVFDDSVRVDELETWMGNGNPPVYVSSVNYGRMLFAVLESDSSAAEITATFNATYKSVVSGDAQASADLQRKLANTKITVVQFGASGGAGVSAAADVIQYNNFDGIYDFLRTSGDFGPTNPGVPISYQMRSLYDSKPVRLAATTEYTKTVCTPELFGCDGNPKSGARLDDCNVCGGTNICKRPCPAVTHELGNDYVFVFFDLPQTAVGQSISYTDGAFQKYYFPRCYRVKWSGAKYTCQETPVGGEWKQSFDWSRDAICWNEGITNQEHMRVRTAD